MSIKERAEEWWIGQEFTLSKNQCVAALVLAALIILGWLYYYIKQPSSEVKISVPQVKESKHEKMATSKVVVHVAGNVQKPGVYKLNKGSRLIDAVEAAGGFTKEADPNSLNLASKVSDSQKIEVLTKLPAGPKGVPTISGTPVEALINLNTATEEQLDELPGIGETMAKRILDFRTDVGSFKSIEQLKEIEGIGPKKFAKIKPKVTL